MNRSRFAAAALTIVALAVAGAGILSWLRPRHETPASAAVSTAAPVVSAPQPDAVDQLMNTPLSGMDGKTHELGIYRGRVLVVNFWASWCAPCVREMPTLAKLASRYAGKGVQFVGIGVDSSRNIQAFLQKVPVHYPIFVGGFGATDLARRFGNTAGALPFTVVIDANGTVRSTKLGEVVPTELEHTLDAM